MMLGMVKVCSIPPQKSILVRLTLAGRFLVATAILEVILRTFLQSVGPTTLRALLYPPERGCHTPVVTTW